MQSAPNELDRLMGERVRHAQDYQKVLASRDDKIDRLRHGIGPGSERWKSLIDRREGRMRSTRLSPGRLVDR